MAFHNGCLRGIYRIFWPRSISKFELHAKTNFEPIQTTTKMRRLWWLGNILRMSHNRIPRVALRWTPQSERKPPGEEQSRKRLRQWVSHEVRRKLPLWTELVGGREWRPHAPFGAKSKKKRINQKRTVVQIF